MGKALSFFAGIDSANLGIRYFLLISKTKLRFLIPLQHAISTSINSQFVLAAPTFKSFLESSSDEIGDKQKDLMIHQIPGQLPEQGEPKQDEKLKIMKKDVAIQCVVDSEIPNHEWRIHDKKIEVLGEPPAIAEVREDFNIFLCLFVRIVVHLYTEKESSKINCQIFAFYCILLEQNVLQNISVTITYLNIEL